jgi:hypothetical protein
MAILIDSEATTETALSVHSKYGIYSNQDISSGRAARFTRNLDEAGSYPLVFIRDDHTSNTQPALSIQQDGAGNALLIDQEGESIAINIDTEAQTSKGIYLDCRNQTTGAGIYIDSQGANRTTGEMLRINSDDSNTDARNLLSIINDNAAATGATCLFLDQDANKEALFIDAENSTIGAVDIHCDALTTGRIARFYSSTTDNSTRELVNITNDSASADNTVCLMLQQDGDDAHIEFAGAGGGGIKFSASAMDSADANTLDDYEEGTWTPVVNATGGAMTMNTQIGKYTKVGNLVVLTCNVSTSSLNGRTGDCHISGAPFSPENDHFAAMAVGGGSGLAITAGYSLGGYMDNSTTNIYPMIWDRTSGPGVILASEWTDDGAIQFTLTHRV